MSKLTDAIPNRVRALRQERGWSLAQLAERTGSTAPTIMKLERSMRRLDLDWIQKLADAFDMEPSELAFGATAERAVRAVPVVGTIAAGGWKEAIAHSDESIVIPDALAGDRNSFALRPVGDSMNLVVPEGGFVIVDPDDLSLREGKIYAVMNSEGDTTVKRYRSDPARLEPCSTNPEHQPIDLGRAPFTVIGRVVGTYAKM